MKVAFTMPCFSSLKFPRQRFQIVIIFLSSLVLTVFV